jgi:hypothetical protein
MAANLGQCVAVATKRPRESARAVEVRRASGPGLAATVRLPRSMRIGIRKIIVIKKGIVEPERERGFTLRF